MHTIDFFLKDCIEVNKNKLGGKPTLKGTRFSISQLLAELSDGNSVQDISEDYDLNEADIQDFLFQLSGYFNQT